MKPKLKQSEGRRVEVENDVVLDKIAREGVGRRRPSVKVTRGCGRSAIWGNCQCKGPEVAALTVRDYQTPSHSGCERFPQSV